MATDPPSAAPPPTSGLPRGTLAVAVGVMVSGVAAYGYLLASARAVGPRAYSGLSAQWSLVLLVGPGVFATLEQEVGRAVAARHSVGLGGRPVVVRAAMTGGLLLVVMLGAGALAWGPVVHRLFDGDSLLLVGTLIALVGYYAQFLVRGVLAGVGAFRRYGVLVAAEGLLRFFPCLVLSALAISSAGAYGIIFGLAPLTAIAFVGGRGRPATGAGPAATWSELSSALGYLLAASLLAQGLINTAPLAVKLLATKAQDATAGRFLAGLIVARVPLFLFGALQASLLPSLSRQAASGLWPEFRHSLRRLLLLISGFGLASTVGAFALGPTLFPLLFGSRFRLGHLDFAYLGGASAAYMIATVLAQALIALRSYRRMVAGWALGLATLAGLLAVHGPLLPRVEHSFLAGTAVAAVAMALSTTLSLRRGTTSVLSAEEQRGLALPAEP
jgi:O-antigen/teichoic acid export membrane protein